MHLQSKLSATIAVVIGLVVCAGARMQAQDSGSQNQQGSSSQTQPTAAPSSQSPDNQTPSYGVYVSVDPLAKVRFDNRWDLSLGMAYDHMKAGPNLLTGSNLGGLDMDGSYWLTKHWGLIGSGRAYVGTALPTPAPGFFLKGALVKQYFFTGGAEWLGPHNKHGDMMAHAMFGGVYGNFEKDLLKQPAGSTFGFYYNQIAPAAIVGGSIDLNRSEHWVFRINPDAVMTHYTFSDAPTSKLTYAQYDVNFAISVGLEYKFTKIKRSLKKDNWTHGW